MKTFIELEKVRFHAFHGVMEQERLVGNQFEVNIRVGYDFSEAMRSDNLDATINYALIYDAIKEEMMKPSQLIEHVGGRIIDSITSRWPEISSIELKVSKLAPPIVGDIERSSILISYP